MLPEHKRRGSAVLFFYPIWLNIILAWIFIHSWEKLRIKAFIARSVASLFPLDRPGAITVTVSRFSIHEAVLASRAVIAPDQVAHVLIPEVLPAVLDRLGNPLAHSSFLSAHCFSGSLKLLIVTYTF